ncbi:hypothetical protein B0H17DRAFT_1130610 [Mycena rosella]|uniref:Uncharacterized protein n=1 Tax=Mycena rosella TaxID=1033263 RepID=A0AAD7DQ03_MYCRO|nr:hypothetical protein B0H17DRAFT_1130610 [Mycena rosella]
MSAINTWGPGTWLSRHFGRKICRGAAASKDQNLPSARKEKPRVARWYIRQVATVLQDEELPLPRPLAAPRVHPLTAVPRGLRSLAQRDWTKDDYSADPDQYFADYDSAYYFLGPASGHCLHRSVRVAPTEDKVSGINLVYDLGHYFAYYGFADYDEAHYFFDRASGPHFHRRVVLTGEQADDSSASRPSHVWLAPDSRLPTAHNPDGFGKIHLHCAIAVSTTPAASRPRRAPTTRMASIDLSADPPPFDPGRYIRQNNKFPASDVLPEVHTALAELLKLPQSLGPLFPWAVQCSS